MGSSSDPNPNPKVCEVNTSYTFRAQCISGVCLSLSIYVLMSFLAINVAGLIVVSLCGIM